MSNGKKKSSRARCAARRITRKFFQANEYKQAAVVAGVMNHGAITRVNTTAKLNRQIVYQQSKWK